MREQLSRDTLSRAIELPAAAGRIDCFAVGQGAGVQPPPAALDEVDAQASTAARSVPGPASARQGRWRA